MLKKFFVDYFEYCKNFMEKVIVFCWLMKNLEDLIRLDFFVNYGDLMNELKY